MSASNQPTVFYRIVSYSQCSHHRVHLAVCIWPSSNIPVNPCCLARSYRAMSRVIAVFLLWLMTMKLTCCVCFKGVVRVCHSWTWPLICKRLCWGQECVIGIRCRYVVMFNLITVWGHWFCGIWVWWDTRDYMMQSHGREVVIWWDVVQALGVLSFSGSYALAWK